jgi:hypothetical protein
LKNSFLFQIFKTLSKNELFALQKWVQSPAHNQKEEVTKLAEYLVENKKRLDEVNKEGVFSASFGKKEKFDAQRLNRVLSDLTIVMRDFLAYQEWQSENNGFSAPLYACRNLRKRSAGAEFQRQFALLDRESLAQPYRNADWQHFRYLLQQELVQWRVVHDRDALTDLNELRSSLGNYFMLENLRWSSLTQSMRTLSRTAEEAPLAAIALENAARLDPEANPSVALMLQSLQTIREEANETDFINLKNLIEQFGHLFPASESRDFYMSAINFCIRRHNRGELAYTREALAIYKIALDKEVLLDNGIVSIYAYNNIHALAQLLGDREWSMAFLEKYQNHLPSENRENVFKYNLAIHHFRIGDYHRALEQLRELQFSEVFINLDVRRMLLRSYFELGEWLPLASLLESFNTYIKRQEKLGYHRDSYLNLIKYTKKFQKSAGKLTKTDALKMKKAIENEKFVAEREWLLRVVGI